MPMYEFDRDRRGARFEDLVGAGTEPTGCRVCGADGVRRVYPSPAPEPRLVKTGAAARRQDARNAGLRARAKRQLVNARRRARARRGGSP